MPFPYTLPIVFSSGVTPAANPDTAGDIVNTAAIQLGLDAFDDPFVSQDPLALQLTSLLKSWGRRLWRERRWQFLTREFIFTTVLNQSVYALPADYGRMVNETAQSRTRRWPLGGPVASEEWQYLKARWVGGSTRLFYRIVSGQLSLYPDTDVPAGEQLAYEYISKYWVQSQGTTAPDKDAPTASSDFLGFDTELCVLGLKLEWLGAKGLPAGGVQEDYERQLLLVCEQDVPAPIISIGEWDFDAARFGFGNISPTIGVP